MGGPARRKKEIYKRGTLVVVVFVGFTVSFAFFCWLDLNLHVPIDVHGSAFPSETHFTELEIRTLESVLCR